MCHHVTWQQKRFSVSLSLVDLWVILSDSRKRTGKQMVQQWNLTQLTIRSPERCFLYIPTGPALGNVLQIWSSRVYFNLWRYTDWSNCAAATHTDAETLLVLCALLALLRLLQNPHLSVYLPLETLLCAWLSCNLSQHSNVYSLGI